MGSTEHSPTSSQNTNRSTTECSEDDPAFFLDSDLVVPYSSSPATSSPACVATPPDLVPGGHLGAADAEDSLVCEEHLGSDRVSQARNTDSVVDN